MTAHANHTFDGSMATDAEFRAISQFIHDTFNFGWVQTSDTGQINLTTVSKPGAGNTVAGYEVWRMDDALQATVPLFAKVEYGTAAAATSHSIWLTIGKGSDGSGNISNVLFPRRQIGQSASNVNTGSTYGAAGTDGNWITCGILSTLAQAYWFSIERSKDGNGDDTGDAVIVAGGQATASHFSHYCPYTGSIPTVESGLQFILSTVSPSTFGTDTGIGIMIPMKGVAQQPGLNVALIVAADFATGATITFDIYGASHTYQRMDGITTLRGSIGGMADASIRLALRYE